MFADGKSAKKLNKSAFEPGFPQFSVLADGKSANKFNKSAFEPGFP